MEEQKVSVDEKIKEDLAKEGKTAEKLDIKGLKMKQAPAGFVEVISGGQSFYKSKDGLSVFMTLEQSRAVHISVCRKSRRPEWKDIDRVCALFVPKGVQPMLVLPPAGSPQEKTMKCFVNLFFFTNGSVEGLDESK